MVQEIYIIDDDDSSVVVFRELFKNDTEYKFISVKTEQIDIALKNIPALIVINEDAIDRDVVSLCRKIRKDEDNTITPVIVVSSKGDKEHRVEILKESIEPYIFVLIFISPVIFTGCESVILTLFSMNDGFIVISTSPLTIGIFL